MTPILHADVVVIGAGLAGLTAASHLNDRTVTVLSPPNYQAASYLARGGIAVALGEDDHPDHHIRDTIDAGAGIVDPSIAALLAHDGIDRVIDLFELAVPFDRDAQGHLELGREALHSRARIVHADGDATGFAVTTVLRRHLEARPDEAITFLDGQALELITDKGRVIGVVFLTPQKDVGVLLASAVILATGGVGGLFEKSTNPTGAQGAGIALAARAGATLVDLEFVQFHPTALATHSRPLPLLSEALRGQGARLIDANGHPIMAHHPRGDLAGRDEISRTIWKYLQNGQPVFLDTRPVHNFAARFPSALQAAHQAGFDPLRDPLPLTPAAHYHMGGVATDSQGQTSLPGLWAAGEVASTGVHGANRLASNSLLEALVFGARAAHHINSTPRSRHPLPLHRIRALCEPWQQGLTNACHAPSILARIRNWMWQYVGIERSEHLLNNAQTCLHHLLQGLNLHDPSSLPAETALAITQAAVKRTESRGAHFRLDHPHLDPRQASRSFTFTRAQHLAEP